MSKEIYFCSEDKKYKCAVELADSCDRFGCPGHSMIILTEERPDGTYVIAQARDKILETEKDKQIADLQHRLEVAERTTKLACDYLNAVEGDKLYELCKDIYNDNDYLMAKMNYFKEQAESEIKGE